MAKSNIVKNYIYNFLYQIFVLLMPIILSPYLSRILGSENLGIYSYIYSSCSIVSTICMTGTYNYGTRQIAYVRDNFESRNKIYWELFWIRVALGALGVVGYSILAVLSEYGVYFFLFSGWLIAGIVDPSWLFIGMEDMKPTVLKNFAVKLLSVLLIFRTVRGKGDLWKYCAIMGTTMLSSTIVLLFQTVKYVKAKPEKIGNVKKHLGGAIELFLPQVATLFYLQVDKVMIKWLTNDISQVSFYDQAEKIVTIPLTFITVLSTVMMPRIANEYANKNNNNIQRLLLKAAKLALFMACPMMMGLGSVSHGFIPWYLGNEFAPTATAIVVICPIVISNSLAGISGNQFFTATNQVDVLMKAYASAAVMNIIVNALLIPHFGFIGAAVATLFSSYSSVLIQYYYLEKQMKIVKEIIRSLLKYLAVSVIMGMIVGWIKNIAPVNPLSTLFEVCCGAFFYFVVMFITRDEILMLLINAIKSIISNKIKLR